MRAPRVYLDTSVVGGCEDEEFKVDSLALFRDAKQGLLRVLVSDHLIRELVLAPEPVRRHLLSVPENSIERVILSSEAEELGRMYVKGGVLGPGSIGDAYHVAVATIARADVLASWNFKHIVHYDKCRLFNAINLREGYGMIEIRTPREIAQP